MSPGCVEPSITMKHLSQELLLGLVPLDMVPLAEQRGWRGQQQMLVGGITLCSLASSAGGT